jgi:hypothetical protein
VERLDPWQKLSLAVLFGAMKQAEHETYEKKNDPKALKDTPAFADVLFLMSPEAELYFDLLGEVLNGFPSQRDFIRRFLFRTQGWQNFMEFLNRGDKLAKVYERIVDEYMDDLDIVWRKNEQL